MLNAPLSPSRASRAALALAALALVGACGKAPKPAAPPQVGSAPADRGPLSGSAGAGATAGGVPLAEVPEPLARIALALATRPDSATRDLLAAGAAAAPLARALLDSLNLNELEAALAFFAHAPDGAPLARIATLLAHDAPAVRDAARRALALQRGDALAQAVAPLTTHATPAVRVDAIRVLAGVGGPLARAALEASLEDPDDAVVLEAGAGLGRLGPPASQPLLDALFSRAEARPAQRRAAFTLARRAGGVVPAAAVGAALDAAADLALGADAARAVARVPAEERDALIVRAAADPRFEVRRALLEGLAAARLPELTARAEALARDALRDPEPLVRVAALATLGGLVPAPAPEAAKADPGAAPAPESAKADPGAAPAAAARVPAPASSSPAAAAPAGASDAAVATSPPGLALPPAAPVFDERRWGPLPNLIAASIADPAAAVRATAIAVLARYVRDPGLASLFDARLDVEPDAAVEQVLLTALARLRTRDALARVIGRLGPPPLGPMAHLALVGVARQELAPDAAVWRAWLDRVRPAGTPEPPPTRADEPDEEPLLGAADPSLPTDLPVGAVEPEPDGSIPAHMTPDGRWIPRKPAPKPPGTPRKPRPTLTNVPG